MINKEQEIFKKDYYEQQYKDANITFENIELELDIEVIKKLEEYAKELNTTLEVVIQMSLSSYIFSLEKDKYKKDFDEVIELSNYLVNAEILDISKKTYFVFNDLNLKNHMVSIPEKEYNNMKSALKET
jgi:hypothetical protein